MGFQGFLKKDTAVSVTILMVSSSDHVSGKTGLTLTIYATKAAGTPTLYGTHAALARDAAGRFHSDVTTDENGEWNFRFEGTGSCTAVEEESFNVTSVF